MFFFRLQNIWIKQLSQTAHKYTAGFSALTCQDVNKTKIWGHAGGTERKRLQAVILQCVAAAGEWYILYLLRLLLELLLTRLINPVFLNSYAFFPSDSNFTMTSSRPFDGQGRYSSSLPVGSRPAFPALLWGQLHGCGSVVRPSLVRTPREVRLTFEWDRLYQRFPNCGACPPGHIYVEWNLSVR